MIVPEIAQMVAAVFCTYRPVLAAQINTSYIVVFKLVD
jgi:hypothetical protein